MSEPTSKSAPLVSVFAIFALFALFLLVIHYVYEPRETGPFTGDGLHTTEQRKENLTKLRAEHTAQATSYAWIDQKAGTVQLPIDRAEELTLQHYAQK
jgi:hypothetical protein